jgi:formate dehydrogenase major subunit
MLSMDTGFGSAAKDFDWMQRSVPCRFACPAGTDVPGYLRAIAQGEYEKAYRINLADNVFPGILGRVCARPCEDACRHGNDGNGDSVAICFSKRAAADQIRTGAIKLDPYFPVSGKSVAVIGAGVAGLAAARDLALMGHEVTVLEKHDSPGGMLNQGIPVFRLPRDVIEREIEQVRLTGVDIQCGIDVDAAKLAELRRDYDAVILAGGTLKPNLLQLPGSDLDGIRHGLPFLLGVNELGETAIGDHVVVIGGGFTAMDCARTAQRLGATEVGVYYRRSEAEMLVTKDELLELKHETIPMHVQVSPKRFLGEDGKLTAVEFIKTTLGRPGADGRRRPVEVPDSEFTVSATTVLLATGQHPDLSWLDEQLISDAQLASGNKARTVLADVFVAGDYALGATTLIDAIGHARTTARETDAYLMGRNRFRTEITASDVFDTGRTREDDEIPHQEMPTLPLADRGLTAEVESGYKPSPAKKEAKRCYLCNFKFEIDNERCIYCDGCLRVKPKDDCIIKVKSVLYADDGRITSYEPAKSAADYNLLMINPDSCIRCGACADVCPVDCITVQDVNQRTVPDGD